MIRTKKYTTEQSTDNKNIIGDFKKWQTDMAKNPKILKSRWKTI